MRDVMTTSIRDLLSTPPLDRWASPVWIEPDLLMIDDVTAPAVLEALVEGFGTRDVVADPSRVRCVSTVDRDDSLLPRLRGDDLLQAFAEHHGIQFERFAGACANGCPLPVTSTRPRCVASTAPIEGRLGAHGGLALRIHAADAAVALATNRVWYRRPPVHVIELRGQLGSSATIYDLAIALRPQIKTAELVVVRGVAFSELCRETLCALLEDSPASGVLCEPEIAPSIDATTALALDELETLIGEGSGAVHAVAELAGASIDRAYIGSCTTGAIGDLRHAARTLAGSTVVIPTIISPSSVSELERLETERLDPDDDESPNLVQVFQAAGCDIGMPGCSSCVNAIADLMESDDEPAALTCIATAVGNVTTQKAARVLTASPATVARVAITGRV